MGYKIVKLLLLLILLVSFIFALIDKVNNPDDFRHPRDRSIKLYWQKVKVCINNSDTIKIF